MIDQLKEVANSAITNFRSTPVFFGVLMLNLLMVGAALYFLIKLRDTDAAEFSQILDRCLPK